MRRRLAITNCPLPLQVFQSLGGALVVSAGQSIFQNELFNALPLTAPGVNPAIVFNTGASKIQSTFSAAELPGIDSAYVKGLRMAFALAIPMAGAATLVAVAQKWFRLTDPEKGDLAERDENKVGE